MEKTTTSILGFDVMVAISEQVVTVMDAVCNPVKQHPLT